MCKHLLKADACSYAGTSMAMLSEPDHSIYSGLPLPPPRDPMVKGE